MQYSIRDTLIWLNQLGVLSDKITKLETYLGDIREIHKLDKDLLLDTKLLSKTMIESIKSSNYEIDVKKQVEKANNLSIQIITDSDEDYPQQLFVIEDRPRVLYQKGTYLDDDNLSIAIVGSRKLTSYGKWASEKFSKELANIGVTIVSGLAHGVDRVAHLSALESGGRTIGILGNGIDNIYPKSNRSIYEDIPNNGCIISEFPLGTEPLQFHFPMRNRIISGLSLAVIVIEAQEKSGSLITSSHAINQGKDVFAVPGNINSLYSKGTKLLIRDGAIPLLDIDDILREVNDLQILKNNKKYKETLAISLSDSEKKIVNVLKTGPVHCDMISLNTGMDIQTVLSIIMILEMKNVVREMGSRVFVLN